MSKVKTQRGPQTRGIERRKQLISAADALLLEGRNIDDISLADIAGQAGIPVASAYTLFSNVDAVMAQLLIRHTDQLIEQIEASIEPGQSDTWMQIIESFIDGMVAYYRTSQPAQQLRLSGRALPDVRYTKDRQTGTSIAKRLRQIIETSFDLPPMEGGDRPLVIMLDIADAVIVSEFVRTRSLPRGIAAEAKRASIAYLKLYIPERLPPRASFPAPEPKRENQT